jgi:hypothetical protein
VSGQRRHHLIDHRRRYREAAEAGAWEVAKLEAILLRRHRCDTDVQYANALYAEGYAHEKLGDLRLAEACYKLAVLLTGHLKAARRLQAIASAFQT